MIFDLWQELYKGHILWNFLYKYFYNSVYLSKLNVKKKDINYLTFFNMQSRYQNPRKQKGKIDYILIFSVMKMCKIFKNVFLHKFCTTWKDVISRYVFLYLYLHLCLYLYL